MKNQTVTTATQWNYKKEIADEKPPAEHSTRTKAKRKSVIEQESINSDDDRKPAAREARKK